MKSVGYSAKPLSDKLALKPNMRVVVLHAPKNYRQLLGAIPAGLTLRSRVRRDSRLGKKEQCIHIFATKQNELEKMRSRLLKALAPGGMLWISWPKPSRTREALPELTRPTRCRRKLASKRARRSGFQPFQAFGARNPAPKAREKTIHPSN